MTDDPAGYDLIVRMRERDVTALAALYDRHATAAYSLACRILRNGGEAEDVVQEAFLQVWQQAWRFDRGRAGVLGWLLMITRSRAIDRLRQTCGRSRRESTIEQMDQLSGTGEWATDRVLIREEKGRDIRRRFEALPAVQRIAVELAFYQGLTHLEIADVLREPLGTVKTRIRLALQKMRGALNGDPTEGLVCEPSPFTVALAEHLANRPLLTATYRRLPGLRLLVVDDDSETAALVATVLQSAGASVATARSTPDGLARLDLDWPDVILADIAMPRDDGYSFLRQAQALAESSGRRLVAAAFTALGDGEGERARHAGFAALISKPVQPDLLVDAVGRLADAAAS
ncbi:MAG: sigma-70 family RNA polymerase sigma factor [Vicinamibacteraceae bacterium]